MDEKTFWDSLESFDRMYANKQIDKHQYSANCVLLGWQWHCETGKALPARPREKAVAQ